MDKFQGSENALGQIITYIYTWIALVLFFLVGFIILIVKYFQDKKINKAENNDKKSMGLRICIYLILGVLLFILSPLILGAFL